MSDPTKQDLIDGIEKFKAILRQQERTHIDQLCSAVERAVRSAERPTQMLAQLCQAAYHAGAAQQLHFFSIDGSHTDGVLRGRQAEYIREHPEERSRFEG